jgi:glycosyltransferase involved in cell wall biosynthesis
LGYKHVLSQAVRKAKKIIVPLNTVKDDLIKTLGVAADKIVVTREGVDEKISRKSSSHKVIKLEFKFKNYFLYVGNAYPHKNLERLIKAFQLFISDSGHGQNDERKGKDIKLILVGKDDYFYRGLRKKVERMDLSHSIIFKNDVSDDELSALYASATALISPSLMEGFGLPPLEAMALSCPVVLSDIPSFREVCGNAAFYFDPHSVSAISEKIQYVYGITEKTKAEHIKRGLMRVEDFSWERMAKETLEVYESSINI